MREWIGRTLLLIFVGLPVLGLSSCVYFHHSPHLRLDRLNVVLMDGPRDPELGWRTMSEASATCGAGLGACHFACGESLFVELGIQEHALTQASGYSRYTCL